MRKLSKFMLQKFADEARGNTDEIWDKTAADLLNITQHCRPSMHEPDEYGVSAQCHNGKGSFDNAGNRGEIWVSLQNDDADDLRDGTEESASFNLADLFALARMGAALWLDWRKKEKRDGNS